MSSAFRCDACGDYHDGTPAGRFYLYEGQTAREDGAIDSDICEGCLEKAYNEFTREGKRNDGL